MGLVGKTIHQAHEHAVEAAAFQQARIENTYESGADPGVTAFVYDALLRAKRAVLGAIDPVTDLPSKKSDEVNLPKIEE